MIERLTWWNSVWRVLKGPNNAWPLAVCDSKTIDREHDVCANDVLHEWWVGENQLLHKNDQHAWYYLSNQDVDDLIVFRNMDSKDRRASEQNLGDIKGCQLTIGRHRWLSRCIRYRSRRDSGTTKH